MVNLPRKKLLAVHDTDVEEFLTRLELLAPIKDGKISCAACNRVITLDNFGGIYPESGELKVVCDKLECLNPMLKAKSER